MATMLASSALTANASDYFADPSAAKPSAVYEVRQGVRTTGIARPGLPLATERPLPKAAASSAAARLSATAPGVGFAPALDKLPATALQFDYDSANAFLAASATTLTIDGTALSIANFGGNGVTIAAEVDPTTGTVTIPRQTGYVSSTYGTCDLRALNEEMTQVVDGPLQGVVEEGVLTLGPWTLVINEGDYAGYSLGNLVKTSTYIAPNATMNATVINDGDADDTSEAYPVVCEQSATNQVDVYNFLGMGYKWEIRLNGDKSLTIIPQHLFTNNSYGAFYYYKYDAASGTTYMQQPIVGTTEGNRLAWGNATIHTSNGKYYLKRFRASDIQLPFELTYPAAQTQAGFKGNGTEEDPYLIETLADLMALSDSVNFATAVDATRKYARAFEGKYFKQTKAINAKGVNFPPIGGSDDLFRFAGTYDGGGKTISNLTVNTGSRGYAGLFGSADTIAVIKNVVLSTPAITATGYYFTGAIAGNCPGSLQNCKVTNATVSGSLTVGGVAGQAGASSQCSFTGTVSAVSQVGGVFGVTRFPCSFLSATNTTVTSSSATSQSPLGGIVGSLTDHRGGSLSDCYFSGKIVITTVSQFAGGIAGTTSHANIERCFSVGEIYATCQTSSTNAIGGIVGASAAAEINDCYFAGENLIRGTRSGGIVGYIINVAGSNYPDHTTLQRCYITGLTSPTSSLDYTPYVGYFDTRTEGSAPKVVNCYYDSQLLPTVTSLTGARPTSELSGTAPNVEGFAGDVWTFADGLYPRLSSIAANDPAYLSAAPLSFANERENVETITHDFTGSIDNSVKWYVLSNGSNAADGHGLSVDSSAGEFHLNGAFANDTLVAVKGTERKYVFVKLAPDNLFLGSGSQEDPYIIANKADLMKLSAATIDNLLSFNGTHFKLTADIDMEGDEAFRGIGIPGTTQAETYGFGGIIDGDNHTIHNIKMITCHLDDGGTILADEKVSNRGFVNNLKAVGAVKNLRLAPDCQFVFYSRSAAVVGYNYGGLIENCRNYADVIGYSGTVAGITSSNGKSKGSTAVVRNCYNSGKIAVGYQFAGGITNANYGVVEYCQNVGEVCGEVLCANYTATKLQTAGGICHTNFGTVHDVINTGYVHTHKYAGGILGWFNNSGAQIASNAINLGIVEYGHGEEGTIGEIVGKKYKDGVMSNCFYDGQLALNGAMHNADYEGATALTTERLTDGTPIDGFSTDHWTFTRGRYPMLTAFADEPGAQAGAMSVVFFGDNARRDAIKRDCSLSEDERLTWRLTDGQASFAIDGGSLLMDPAATLTDTITASFSGFVKVIALAALPDTVPTPTIALGDGIATFACELDGVAYHYTLNGDTPTTASPISDGILDLHGKTCLLQVIAAKHNYVASRVASADVAFSGIADVAAGRSVASRRYVTTTGIVADRPAQGVNIVVTTYADGSSSVEKVVTDN